MQDDEEGWIAEFEASGESELRDRPYRGSGMHPEAKFHLAVRWLREQARARRLQEEQMRRDVRRTLWAAVAAVLVGIVGIGMFDPSVLVSREDQLRPDEWTGVCASACAFILIKSVHTT